MINPIKAVMAKIKGKKKDEPQAPAQGVALGDIIGTTEDIAVLPTKKTASSWFSGHGASYVVAKNGAKPYRLCEKRSSTKGGTNGAFGNLRMNIDADKALNPEGMRKRYPAKTKLQKKRREAANNARQGVLAAKAAVGG